MSTLNLLGGKNKRNSPTREQDCIIWYYIACLPAYNWSYKRLKTPGPRGYYGSLIGLEFRFRYFFFATVLFRNTVVRSQSNWFVGIWIFSRKKPSENTADDKNDVLWCAHIQSNNCLRDVSIFFTARLTWDKKKKLGEVFAYTVFFQICTRNRWIS